MDKLRFALIGAGGIGASHYQTLAAHPRAEVVVACDIAEAAVEPLAAAGIATTADWHEALDRDDLDAAVVVLPHHLYPEVVNAALERGLHVLKEKPFARDLADAKAMVAAAEKAKGVLMVAGQGKYSPGFQRAKQIVDSGALGDVFLARGVITYRWGGAITDNWRWRGTRELSGGTAVIDSGWHILDILSWLRGLPETVYCSTGRGNALPGDYDVDDRAVLTLEYPDGGVGSVICCFICLPNRREVLLHGTRASLEAVDDCVKLHTGNQQEAEVIRFQVEANALLPQLNHFFDLVDSGAAPMAGAREAYDIQRIIDAAYRSADSHRPEALAD